VGLRPLTCVRTRTRWPSRARMAATASSKLMGRRSTRLGDRELLRHRPPSIPLAELGGDSQRQPIIAQVMLGTPYKESRRLLPPHVRGGVDRG
jgi:hypothetical protein